MPAADLQVTGKQVSNGKIEITLSNAADNTVAFFNRVALTDQATGKRILPAFYSDNYISILPGQAKTIYAEYPVSASASMPAINVYGWNVPSKITFISK
jgi:hypothetical protein